MNLRKSLLVVLMAASLGPAATLAEPTLVKYSTSGSGVYDVLGINLFDWESTGDMLAVNALPTPALANGNSYNTFAEWYVNALPGEMVTFNLHAHARLVAMVTPSGGIRPATLSSNGATCVAGVNCFEITAALSGEETAVLQPNGVLQFVGASGNYAFYHDTTPDSNVGNTDTVSPTNFADGVAFLQGTFYSALGTALPTGVGNTTLLNTVDSYNPNFIGVDSATLDTLVGTTFGTEVFTPSSLGQVVPVGDPIGLTPYIRLSADVLWKADANTYFDAVPTTEEGFCRMTGGGVDSSGEIVAGTLARGSDDTDTTNRYTFGGQVGAPTASQPQPYGEWTHHQQKGPAGDFVFHAGTASAPKLTKITDVTCADPGWCIQARPAPFKQLEWKGTGSFRSVRGALSSAVVPDNKKNFTVHYFRAFIQDTGEPGAGGKQTSNPVCTAPRYFGDPVNCGENCPDYYYIEIHATADPASPIIYKTEGFIDGGNLQIHPAIK